MKRTLTSAILAAAALSMIGCASYQNPLNGENQTVPLKSLVGNPWKYRDMKVTVKGYLDASGENLILSSTANYASKKWRKIPVTDTSPGGHLSAELESPEKQCTEKYVALTGIVGQHPQKRITGIQKILKIEVFSNRLYTNSEGYCYAAYG